MTQSRPTPPSKLSLTRKVGVVGQNAVVLTLPGGARVVVTLWEWPAGQKPLKVDGSGEPLEVRMRIDAPRDVHVLRGELEPDLASSDD